MTVKQTEQVSEHNTSFSLSKYTIPRLVSGYAEAYPTLGRQRWSPRIRPEPGPLPYLKPDTVVLL